MEKYNYENFDRLFKYWVDKFFADGGDDRILYNFNLNEKSIVFDLGAYEGEFYSKILSKYNCFVHAFEPIKSFYDTCPKIREKLKLNNFALGNQNTNFEISLLGNCSSSFLDGKKEICKKIKFIDYVDSNNIQNIDLLKINIEGAEYELLEEIISKKYQIQIKNILVQFHNLSNNPIERRQEIIQKLQETHKLKFSYDFVWECFEKK